MWSGAASFNFHYPLIFLRSCSSCLCLLPCFSITSVLLFSFASGSCFQRQFFSEMWSVQLAFLLCIVSRMFLNSLSSGLLLGVRWFKMNVSEVPSSAIFKGRNVNSWTSWPLKMGLISSSKTLVLKHFVLQHNSEDGRVHFNCCGGLGSCTGCSFPSRLYVILLCFSHDQSDWFSPSFSSATFETFKAFPVYLLNCSGFSTIQSYASFFA